VTRLPKRYRDLLPVAPPIAEQPVEPEQPLIPTPLPVIPITEKITVTTDANSFGVYRVYNGRLPTHNPDENFSVNHVADGPSFTKSEAEPDALPPGPFEDPKANITVEHPFANDSIFNLMSWFYMPLLSRNTGNPLPLLHLNVSFLNSIIVTPFLKSMKRFLQRTHSPMTHSKL
jgi:hypothetical protein